MLNNIARKEPRQASMYKHILIPTDGSEIAERAVEAGIEFARWAKARVTGFTAVPEYELPSEGAMASGHALSMTEHDVRSRKKADEILARVAEKARAASVDFDADFVQSDHPWEAIVAAAHKHGCDLIFIASHGRRGFSALMHGSETHGVLTHCKIPTLVYR
jgi:nucleotide-binding universal stress UspA family protein